jgi:hypothetical protein
MKRRWPSAKITSNASDDLPEPLGPVTTQILPWGMWQLTSFRLCSRAWETWIDGDDTASSGKSDAEIFRRADPGAWSAARSRSASPVRVSRLAMSPGVPSATRRPPSGPPPGPRSRTQSHARMTSRSCSTTITLAPSSTSACSASTTYDASSACSPALGSSTTKRAPLVSSPRARASLSRCASPPDSVDSGCPIGKYPRPTRAMGCSRRRST